MYYPPLRQHGVPVHERQDISLQMVHRPALLALVNWESLQGIPVVVKLGQDTAPFGGDQGTGSVAIILWTDIEEVVKSLN